MPLQRIDRGRGQQPPPFFLSLGFIRGFFFRPHCLHNLIALRLRLNRTANKRRNRFPGPLRGLLRRFKCGRGKDSPLALRRSCGLLYMYAGMMHANICNSKREADAVARAWNESYKRNGTALF